jgi:DNA-binding response OmpR family regulator
MITKYNYNILIVEDNTIIALDMKKSLEKIGFTITDIVSKLSKVSHSITNTMPDVAIVDINLHGNLEGIEIGRYLAKLDIPFMYVTAYSDSEIIKSALETNPICYLIKPLNIEELKSNLLLGIYKSQQSTHNKKINIGLSYIYDFTFNTLSYENQIIPLTNKETIILKSLLNAKGEIVVIKELESQLWKDKILKESALRTLIYRMRLKLPKNFIQTIPNVGFKLIQEN